MTSDTLPRTGGIPRVAGLEVAPQPHWGRRIAAAILLIILAGGLYSVATNPRFEWNVIWEFLFDPAILSGVVVTIELTILAMIIGIVGAVILALMRLSGNPVLVAVSAAYIWFFRGTPQLVQIIFWGFLGALYPHIFLGIPGTDILFFSAPTSTLVSAFTAALLGLGLNEAAYASEIVRAGILSVDTGQGEAAASLGMTPARTMRRVVLPQAMRVIVPPLGNEVIGMLKTTSLVSVIAGADLLTNAQTIYANNFKIIPLLIVASIWYLALTTILSGFQVMLERRFGRGNRRSTTQDLFGLRGKANQRRQRDAIAETRIDENELLAEGIHSAR